MTINFYKYQATGNDFVMIDNRNSTFPKQDNILIKNLCDRRFGIGADGLILLESDGNYDFRMIYYNANGLEGSMCGNGGRCCVAFAKQIGIIKDNTTFIATDGEHNANIEGDTVSLKMIDVDSISINKDDNSYFLDTGSPHHVEFYDNIKDIDVQKKGEKIRYGAPYSEEGTNVNFAKKLKNNLIEVRTYERGVEDETLSCGTGVTAVAISAYKAGIIKENTVNIKTKGGDLRVEFCVSENGKFDNIYLKGIAKSVFYGQIASHFI